MYNNWNFDSKTLCMIGASVSPLFSAELNMQMRTWCITALAHLIYKNPVTLWSWSTWLTLWWIKALGFGDDSFLFQHWWQLWKKIVQLFVINTVKSNDFNSRVIGNRKPSKNCCVLDSVATSRVKINKKCHSSASDWLRYRGVKSETVINASHFYIT